VKTIRGWKAVPTKIFQISMRKCTGNNTQDWGFDAIFDVKCPNCGKLVEFFKDEINRYCPWCKELVLNDRKDYGCGQWCSPSSPHMYNLCPKFKRSKDRFIGHHI
jgi:endogenous inhibitor of DNA gyrase (YacG/DUF329 family)